MFHFKPALPALLDHSLQRYPVYVSMNPPGMYLAMVNGTLTTSTNKKLRNRFLQQWSENYVKELEGVEGSLVLGPIEKADFGASRATGISCWREDFDFTFWAMDYHDRPEMTYTQRRGLLYAKLMDLKAKPPKMKVPGVRVLSSQLANDLNEVEKFKAIAMKAGYEGVLMRDPNALYKHGKCTPHSQELVKY